jgi:UDP-N-acetylglucosamine acyltransferase
MYNVEAPQLTGIHPTALIDPSATIAESASVGPFSIIGPNVIIGADSRVHSHVLIAQDTTIGSGCEIHHGAVLGTDPQDLKFGGESTRLIIGDRTTIREYATLNRGTAALGPTEVGADCLLMAYVHVAHDCVLGDHVILSNAVNMGGHVEIEEWAIVGGVTAIHQFTRIGAHAFVGGASRVSKDIPPYVRAAGSPIQLAGLNSVGLERRGFSAEVRQELKRAYKLFFHSKYNVTQALQAASELQPLPEVRRFLDFIESSHRGIVV